jgi:hypothetical protein
MDEDKWICVPHSIYEEARSYQHLFYHVHSSLGVLTIAASSDFEMRLFFSDYLPQAAITALNSDTPPV